MIIYNYLQYMLQCPRISVFLFVFLAIFNPYELKLGYSLQEAPSNLYFSWKINEETLKFLSRIIYLRLAHEF